MEGILEYLPEVQDALKNHMKSILEIRISIYLQDVAHKLRNKVELWKLQTCFFFKNAWTGPLEDAHKHRGIYVRNQMGTKKKATDF